MKTILIEEIGSETSLAMDKDSSATVKHTSTVVKDDASSTPKDLTGTVKGSAATTQRESTTVKVSPITCTAQDNSTVVKNESHIVKHLTPKQKQLPGVPSSSITFIHDWKRLQPHPDLQSNYFQVLISLTLVYTYFMYLLVFPLTAVTC